MIIRNELEDSGFNDIETAVRRGECKNIRFVVDLPDMLIRDIKEGKEEETWQEKDRAQEEQE